MLKKLLFILIVLIPINSIALEKETTFNNELFKKAQSEGKVVIVSS